jgi:hypothetical protein
MKTRSTAPPFSPSRQRRIPDFIDLYIIDDKFQRIDANAGSNERGGGELYQVSSRPPPKGDEVGPRPPRWMCAARFRSFMRYFLRLCIS